MSTEEEITSVKKDLSVLERAATRDEFAVEASRKTLLTKFQMKTTEEADSAARKEEKEVQRLELELAKGLSEIQTNFGDLLALAKT